MKKKLRTGLIITASVLVVAVGTLAVLNRPLSRDELHDAVEAQLQKVVDESDGVTSVMLTVAKGDDVHEFAVGDAELTSQFHSASVGKTMLASVYGQLIDEGTVSFDDRIDTYLDAETLEGLFENSEAVTIEQLLGHTSGIADYFEGPVSSGETMLASLSTDPDQLFTPRDLVDFTRERQTPVGAPGERFAYSDTGYIVLGLALEVIEDKPYDEVLDDRIFEPLGMTDSYLMTEFGTASAILPVDVNGVDLSNRNALSVDWSGGGVVTTTADLLTFMRALEGGEVVSDEVHERFTTFASDYQTGVHYGLGIMQFKFSEFSPLLASMTDLYGAVGVTGTFALYDPTTDTHYIANFGSLDYQQKAIEQLVEIRLLFDRLAN